MARRDRQHRDVLQVIDTRLGRRSRVYVAEMGTDMDRFAGTSLLGPGSATTAVPMSKRSPVKKGNASLQSALVEAARAAARTKTYLGAQYHRLARRIGANRAAMAGLHCCHAPPSSSPFVDMGHKYFEVRDKSDRTTFPSPPKVWIPAFAGMTIREIRGIPRDYRSRVPSFSYQ